MQPVMILIGAAAVMFAVIGGLSMLAHYYTLSGIKSKTVGDGQHGTAQWAGKKEIREVYKHIPFDVAHWRQGENLPKEQGLIVGSIGSKGAVTGLVDTGDVHCLMIGAAGVGREGVITQTEKIKLAESYEAVAANCLKAVITLELEQQTLEQNQTPELAPEMAMTM